MGKIGELLGFLIIVFYPKLYMSYLKAANPKMYFLLMNLIFFSSKLVQILKFHMKKHSDFVENGTNIFFIITLCARFSFYNSFYMRMHNPFDRDG